MPTIRMDRLVGHLRFVASRQGREQRTDADLLEQFLSHGEEVAFAEVVRRHGPMILGVCRRVLGNVHDAEDAFQATLLVLARKAATLKPHSCLGPWLYGVARRTALKARSSTARRRRAEQEAAQERPTETSPGSTGSDLPLLVDEVVCQMPEKYQAPLVLCLIQGKSRKEAAGLLGWSEGTLSGRLARAKDLLGDRLRRRGVAPTAVLAGGVFATEVSASLVTATAKSAVSLVGQTTGHGVSASVITLTEEVLTAMVTSKFKKGIALLVLALGIGFGSGAAAWQGGPTPRGTVAGEAENRTKDRGASARKPAAVRADYVIEPPDVLIVKYASLDPADPVKIQGKHLVRPDGTIGLGLMGSVQVSGLTVEGVSAVIGKHLADHLHLDGFDARKLAVEVISFNSKVVYAIVEDPDGSEQVYRLPANRSQTVVDALVELCHVKPALIGLGTKQIYVERKSDGGKGIQTLGVDWKAITLDGQTATNYQLQPGDRLHVEQRLPGRRRVLTDVKHLELTAHPTTEEVVRALPKTWANVEVKNLTFEALVHREDPVRTYPLIGPARLIRVHWKCTVSSDRGVAVLYLDRDHLVPAR